MYKITHQHVIFNLYRSLPVGNIMYSPLIFNSSTFCPPHIIIIILRIGSIIISIPGRWAYNLSYNQIIILSIKYSHCTTYYIIFFIVICMNLKIKNKNLKSSNL